MFLHLLLLLSSSFTLDSNNIIYNDELHAKHLQDFNNASFWGHKTSKSNQWLHFEGGLLKESIHPFNFKMHIYLSLSFVLRRFMIQLSSTSIIKYDIWSYYFVEILKVVISFHYCLWRNNVLGLMIKVHSLRIIPTLK